MAIDVKRKESANLTNVGNAGDVIAALRDVLGSRLVAVIADQDDAVIASWERGETSPPVETVKRLETAWDAVEMLLEVERPSIVRAWFGGLNPMLGDRPPAIVVGEDAKAFMGAAREFLAYG